MIAILFVSSFLSSFSSSLVMFILKLGASREIYSMFKYLTMNYLICNSNSNAFSSFSEPFLSLEGEQSVIEIYSNLDVVLLFKLFIYYLYLIGTCSNLTNIIL